MKAVKLAFPCSNNEAENEALAIELDLAKEMKISKLKINCFFAVRKKTAQSWKLDR